MKRNYMMLILLVASISVMAQITVTNNDFIPLNSKLVIATDTVHDASIIPGSAGANQVWDFSITSDSQIDTLNTIPPEQTPLFNFFPESNYAAYQTGDSMYIYFNRSDDKVQLIGVGFESPNSYLPYLKYTPPETVIDFPMNYGDSYSQTYFTANTIVNPEPGLGTDSIRFKNTIVSQTTVDAYGSLTTPFGTFQTLRSKNFEISYDSVWALVFGNWIAVSESVDSSYSYSWWTNDLNIGFMLYSIDVDAETGEISDISYLKNSIQGVSNNRVPSAKVFPNPANDVLNIEFDKRVLGQLSIYNQAGQTVRNIDILNRSNLHLSVSSFPAGMYVYEVNSSKGAILFRGKFLKE